MAGSSQPAIAIDSSDEEGAHRPPPIDSSDEEGAQPRMPGNTSTVATQTPGTLLDQVQAHAESCSLAVVPMNPVREQFFQSILSCMKMPRGGVNAGGSMMCTFEFVAGTESIVKHLMEDLPLMPNKRYNPTCETPPWEDSPSINTYYALNTHLLDSYLRLHRRRAGRGYRAYRGSLLATPPNTHQSPVCLISACPPFLVELCHRKHDKLVLAVTFHLYLHNDMDLPTLPPRMPYATGMDIVFRRRALNHLVKMRSRHLVMSTGFQTLADAHQSSISDSEGEWVPPLSDLSLLGLPPRQKLGPGWDSGDEADSEDDRDVRASMDTSRPRAPGNSRWSATLRKG